VTSAVPQDEQPEYWQAFSFNDLAARVAALHMQRRELRQAKLDAEIHAARRAFAAAFVRGSGIEVGAGSRPFPIPDDARCYYGDVRDADQLASYFGTDQVQLTGEIDAQTMSGVPLASQDFVISAHVIEHLWNPIGAIEATIRRLKPGGHFLLVVPEMSATWDRKRPPTTLEHVLADWQDGGAGTRLQAYIEHTRFVHPLLSGESVPEHLIEADAARVMAAGMDLHVHAWRLQDFREMLDYVAPRIGFMLAAQLQVVNENLFALRT
jgi:SAM-dependent methyltransferase